jgi:hypothetical protein
MDHANGKSVAPDFSDSSYWKFKAGAMLHRLPVGVTLPQFIDWVIENWTKFPTQHFTWIKESSYPRQPSFPYFAKMYKFFVRAYGELQGHQEIVANKIEAAAQRTRAKRVDSRLADENNALRAKVRELEQRERVITNMMRETPTKPSHRGMVQVNEIDFSSIQPLPAL